MHADILIFAAIAAFLIFRLNALLGTRHGDERPRPNPFSDNKAQQPLRPAPAAPLSAPLPRRLAAPQPAGEIIDAAADKDGRIGTGLSEIALADPLFDASAFVAGARQAFAMIVEAYAKGDLAALKPLLSPKLFADFSAGVSKRLAAGQTSEVVIHRIKAARITEAHLGGVMAYITVDFDVEETSVTRDAAGAVVEGDPDRVLEISDLWTFTRDIRAHDPNWTLIETRASEK